MATIADVARKAGVARTTVSHALSGHRHVAPATRERVLAAARDLGYQPNAAARSLRSRRTRTIGLSIPLIDPPRTLSHSPFGAFIGWIADYLGEREYKLLCLVSRDAAASDVAHLVQAGQVDGMILLQVRLADPRIDVLRTAGIPFVAIGRPRDTTGLICVDADLDAAGEMAVTHLVEMGHRRIAFLGDVPVYGFQYHALAGFRAGCRTHALAEDEIHVLHYDPTARLRDALYALFSRDPEFTALITTTDVEAVTALHVLVELGRCVPDDVAVVTLGDSALAELARPSITAVSFSVADESRAAVELLLSALSGATVEARERMIPVTLIPRSSTAAPRTAAVEPGGKARTRRTGASASARPRAAPSVPNGGA